MVQETSFWISGIVHGHLPIQWNVSTKSVKQLLLSTHWYNQYKQFCPSFINLRTHNEFYAIKREFKSQGNFDF